MQHLKRIARAALYPFFFVVCFLLFSYWTFPWDRVRDFIIQEVETERVGRAAEVEGATMMGAIMVAVIGMVIGALVALAMNYGSGKSWRAWKPIAVLTLNGALITVPVYVVWPRHPEEVRRRPTGYQLEIVDLSPSWVTGVEATGVRFVKMPEEPDERPVDVTFESLRGRIALLPLLVGTQDVTFGAEVAGGTIEGEAEISQDQQHIIANIASVQLRRVGILRGVLPLPTTGALTGDIDLTLAEEAEQTNGSINVQLQGVRVGDGSAKLKLDGMGDGVTVDEINAGNLAFQADVEAGTATIRRLQGRGDDLELDGDGDIQIRQPLRASQLNLFLRAKFSDGYKERSDRTRALFSLLELNPRARAATTEDGALQYRLGGTLGGRISSQAAGRADPPGGSR
ncbi:MAG: type II secretion system protein GspN [Myxococcota bacterium]